MQIYGLFSNAGTTKPTSIGTSAGVDAIPSEQRSTASLAALLGNDTEASTSRAANAKKKLDEIKEQLRTLRFWASDPETLARLAKQLAQQLGSAAQQLAGSGISGADAGAAAVSGIAAASMSEASTAQADALSAEVDQSGQATFVERAYREFDDTDAQSGSDERMIGEFKSVAEQLKQLLRKAEQDLRRDGAGRDADDARNAGHALSAVIAKLDGFGAASGTVAIPSSVSM